MNHQQKIDGLEPVEPWKNFASPNEIVASPGLDTSRKAELLEAWLVEVEERLDAANEGMPPHGETDEDATLLEQLRVAIGKVGDKKD